MPYAINPFTGQLDYFEKSTGSGGGGIEFTDGINTVLDATQLTITGGTIGGTTPNATLTISGGGGSWSITDGVNTVTGVTDLTVTGGTVGGTTPNATLTISGGGTPALTATEIAYGDSSNLMTSSANLEWNNSTKLLGVNGAAYFQGTATPAHPSTGTGIELLPHVSPFTDQIQAYNRTGSAYRALNIDGTSLHLNSNSGGGVFTYSNQLEAGSGSADAIFVGNLTVNGGTAPAAFTVGIGGAGIVATGNNILDDGAGGMRVLTTLEFIQSGNDISLTNTIDGNGFLGLEFNDINNALMSNFYPTVRSDGSAAQANDVLTTVDGVNYYAEAGSGGSGSPGGSSGNIQWNNSSSFAGFGLYSPTAYGGNPQLDVFNNTNIYLNNDGTSQFASYMGIGTTISNSYLLNVGGNVLFQNNLDIGGILDFNGQMEIYPGSDTNAQVGLTWMDIVNSTTVHLYPTVRSDATAPQAGDILTTPDGINYYAEPPAYLTGSVILNQTTPQTFTAGTVTGTGLLNVTSGTIGLDINSYLTSSTVGTYALLLDQTIPQTVINGVPIFNLGIDVANGLIYTSGTEVINFNPTNGYYAIGDGIPSSSIYNPNSVFIGSQIGSGGHAGPYFGGNSVFIGQNVGYNLDNPSNDVFIGQGAAVGTIGGSPDTCVVIGAGAAPLIDSASSIVIIGQGATPLLTEAIQGVAIGNDVAPNMTTASEFTYIGQGAGGLDATGSFNGGYGYNAGPNIDGLTFAYAIGSNSQVGASNCIVLGGISTSAVNVGVSLPTPTARLELPAGTATAGTAPFKIDNGVNLTTPESGAIENDGSFLYYTDNAGTPVRHQITTEDEFIDNEIVSGSVSTWTLANTPTLNSEHIFASGLRLTTGVDYTIAGAVITTTAPQTVVVADYRI